MSLPGPTGSPTRPSDDRWSALEYACHVRDVFRLYDERLEMMLTEGRFRRSEAGLRLPVRVTW
jgi:hypothetical protein